MSTYEKISDIETTLTVGVPITSSTMEASLASIDTNTSRHEVPVRLRGSGTTQGAGATVFDAAIGGATTEAMHFFGAAGENVEVVSDNTNDDFSGNRATTVTLYGSLNGVKTSEVVLLSGTTPAVSADMYNVVYRAEVSGHGASGRNNAGTITMTGSSSSQTAAIIPPLGVFGEVAAYQAELGKSLFLTRLTVYADGPVVLRLCKHVNTLPDFLGYIFTTAVDGHYTADLNALPPFTENESVTVEIASTAAQLFSVELHGYEA